MAEVWSGQLEEPDELEGPSWGATLESLRPDADWKVQAPFKC